jgi:hypothetical protein
MTVPSLPELNLDFCLISLPEQIEWRDALSRSILQHMNLPGWKREEQVAPMNYTIACLANSGLTNPETISKILT